MSKIDLLPNEAILKQNSRITHEKASGRGSWQGELILTNLALIVVHKGALGGVKEILRFPLDQVKVVGEVPQAVSGRSPNGGRQVHVHFLQSVEAFSFSLGASDDDDEPTLKNLLTSPVVKEKRYIEEWCSAIRQAVLGDWDHDPTKSKPPVSQSRSAIGGIVGAIGSGFGTLVSSPSGTPTTPAAACVTARCIGCMAPISGIQGQKAICRYCDTEQVIQ